MCLPEQGVGRAMLKLELESPGSGSQMPLLSHAKLMAAILPFFSPLKITID